MRCVLLPAQVSPYMPLAGSTVHKLDGQTMGTTWSVQVAAPPGAVPDDCLAGIERQLDAVITQMSHWDEGSDLMRFNRAPAGSWHSLPLHFWTVLDHALHVAYLSDGAYDPAAGDLVNAWGFGPVNRYDQPGYQAPRTADIQQLMSQGRPTWRDIQVDAAQRRVQQPGGLMLDLAAIAKGYAVDLVSRYLKQLGLVHHLVEVGGELRGEGMKPEQQPWWVELELLDPAPLLALHDLSVATSGDYRRFVMHEGRRCAHTLDPRTGLPVSHDIAQVTVIHPRCMSADAWSTALMVSGVDEGMRLAEQHNLAALMVARDSDTLVAHASSALQAMMTN
jgi:thiamine biosynthesis lipoprotein